MRRNVNLGNYSGSLWLGAFARFVVIVAIGWALPIIGHFIGGLVALGGFLGGLLGGFIGFLLGLLVAVAAVILGIFGAIIAAIGGLIGGALAG